MNGPKNGGPAFPSVNQPYIPIKNMEKPTAINPLDRLPWQPGYLQLQPLGASETKLVFFEPGAREAEAIFFDHCDIVLVIYLSDQTILRMMNFKSGEI